MADERKTACCRESIMRDQPLEQQIHAVTLSQLVQWGVTDESRQAQACARAARNLSQGVEFNEALRRAVSWARSATSNA